MRLDDAEVHDVVERLGMALPASAASKLAAYAALLASWNRVYNLTAVSDDDTLVRHLADCLAIVPSFRRALPPPADSVPSPLALAAEAWMPAAGALRASFPADTAEARRAAPFDAPRVAPAKTPIEVAADTSRGASNSPPPKSALIATSPPVVLDVGSGGGLPGVVLAIVQPDWQVHCVDTVAKKATFIRQAAAELGLSNLVAHHARVEALALPRVDLITARAFASLSDFVRWTRHLAGPTTRWAAMKATMPDAELGALRDAFPTLLFHVERVDAAVSGAEHRCLVWMRENTADPAGG